MTAKKKTGGNEQTPAREEPAPACEEQTPAREEPAPAREKRQARKKQNQTRGEQDQAGGEENRTYGEEDMTRDGIIRRYLDIYRRCMTEDPKSFDARGAAHALEQISKLLGLTVSAKDTDGNEIVLTLSEEANALGQ